MKKIKHFSSYSTVNANIRVKIDMNRFEKQYKKAQFYLDSAIMASMVPLMPHNTGTFINITRSQSAALAGSGEVVAAAKPFGRYLYMGKVMVDSATGKGPMKIENSPGEFVLRYRKGAILEATDRDLKYSNPRAVPMWFEKAKEQSEDQWIKKVKEIAGGG